MNKEQWTTRLRPFATSSNKIASLQVTSTIIPYVLLWVCVAKFGHLLGLNIAITLLMSFFILRSFSLMHDCGHHSLFESRRLNLFFGWLFGVICAIPQYVWSKHHAYHHATNGDWQRYKGPLNILSCEEFMRLSDKAQKRYLFLRRPPVFFMLGGFLYLLFNPRVTWIKGCFHLLLDLCKHAGKDSPRRVLQQHQSRHFKTLKEFRHMSYNNIGLFCLSLLIIHVNGLSSFLLIHLPAVSIAGGLGLVFFTVQHNFNGSYAADSEHWDYCRGALEGSSFLILPAWLNWFSADIAYHHVHHLHATIPNYQLKKAHQHFQSSFANVPRLSLGDIIPAFYCNLWDKERQIIINGQAFYQSLKLQGSSQNPHNATA